MAREAGTQTGCAFCPGPDMECFVQEWKKTGESRLTPASAIRGEACGTAIENSGVRSYGSASDSSYGVSGISSAGTARDKPKPRSSRMTRAERGVLTRAPCLDDYDASAGGCTPTELEWRSFGHSSSSYRK
jgi:hypothetical protein